MQKHGYGTDVEMARLERNRVHAELDIANLKMQIAQVQVEVNELMQEAGRDAGERMAAQFGPLLDAVFGGAPKEEDVDRASMDFDPFGSLLGDLAASAMFPRMPARG